ncbi:NuoI/complex I 23 kDa subunit family protein [Anaeromyxobacter terrae]|uniref:NuoI/complex I 23 kDa subunit family protein n=1 Tax=Anaeromyxobacter terrae TaxID=2925406 RepID=UPI001F58A064|nr:NADH-quinone oxidoreductase subunit I [Anaeromyxobacter sp. SG22]
MPQTVREYTGSIRNTVKSFWHGLSITLSYLARRPTTVQYPDRTPMPVRDMLPPRYRGFLEVDTAICTGCQACERACPIGCIQISLEKDPANPKQRVVTQFDIDEAKCMFCGLCVEPCPTGSIQHTREFEATQRHIRNLVFRWSDPLKPFPVYKVDKNAEYYPRVPLGSLVRARLETLAWDRAAPVFLPPEPAGAAKPAAQPKVAAAAAAGAAPAKAAAPALKAAPTNGAPAAEKPAVVAPVGAPAADGVKAPAPAKAPAAEQAAAEPAVTLTPETK